MSPATAARLLRLYPSGWRGRYGTEYAVLLEDHPLSVKTFLDILCSAYEEHMSSFGSSKREPAGVGSAIWCAWMAALAAGMILYGMVDDSPFVAAMQGDFFFRSCWIGVEIGSVVAAAAIALGGVPLAFSAFRYALTTRRRDILIRLASPLMMALVLFGWVVTVAIWTGGHWGPSPWAVAFSNAGWPSETFRWITGSISAVLLLFAFGSSAVGISQALHRSEFPEVRFSLPGAKLRIAPLRFAFSLAPWAAAGLVLMFVSVALWGLTASRSAADIFHGRFGPLGLSSSSSWFVSVLLFGAAAAFSVGAARHSMAFRFDSE